LDAKKSPFGSGFKFKTNSRRGSIIGVSDPVNYKAMPRRGSIIGGSRRNSIFKNPPTIPPDVSMIRSRRNSIFKTPTVDDIIDKAEISKNVDPSDYLSMTQLQ
jgi:hypothetical protein